MPIKRKKQESMSVEQFRKEIMQNAVRTNHKYSAQGIHENGIWFASKKEHTRYHELYRDEAMGIISDLRFQPVFEFFVGHFKSETWRVDFSYRENGKKIAEDATGFMTPAKKRKIKLFNDHYPDWELRIT